MAAPLVVPAVIAVGRGVVIVAKSKPAKAVAKFVVNRFIKEAHDQVREPVREEVKDEIKQFVLEQSGIIDEKPTVGVFRAVSSGNPEIDHFELGNPRFKRPNKFHKEHDDEEKDKQFIVRVVPMWDRDP